MDLFELNGHSYLIVEDYYSRWTETIHLKQTTSVAVLEHCKSIFARFGIPEVVLSDNGPQFSSRELLKFSQDYCFTHITSSPYHPQGIGEAERDVQTMKNLLKKSTDPYTALLNNHAQLTSTCLQSGRTDDEPKTQKLCAYNLESTYSLQARSRRIQEEGRLYNSLQKSAEVLPWSSTPSKRSPTTSKRTTYVGHSD